MQKATDSYTKKERSSVQIEYFSPNKSKNSHINRHGMFTVMSSRSTRPENITFSRLEITEEVFKSFVEKNNSKE